MTTVPQLWDIQAQGDDALRGAYRDLITTDPARRPDVGSRFCCLEDQICGVLLEEAEERDGDFLFAVDARRLALVDAGCLQYAAGIVDRNSCVSALQAALKLVTAVLRGATPATYERARLEGVVSPTLALLSRDFVVGAEDNDVAEEKAVRLFKTGYDSLLAIAGLHYDVSPHETITSRPVDSHRRRSSMLVEVFEWGAHLALVTLCVSAAVNVQRYDADSPVRHVLMELLSSGGRVLRFLLCWSLHTSSDQASEAARVLYLAVLRALADNPGNAHLQRWGIVYGLLPLASGSSTLLLHFCLARCCVSHQKWACEPHTIARAFSRYESAEVSLKLVVAAVKQHPSCVRPAARLFCWLARGNTDVQRMLTQLGAAQALRIYVPPKGIGARVPVATTMLDDDDPDGGGDGEALSEWENEYDDGEPSVTERTEMTPALVARALRAMAGESCYDLAQRRVAADAAAAALLAEEERETNKKSAAASASGKKKTRRKKGVKKAAPKAAEPASDADESDGEAAAVDDDEVAARELGARRGGDGRSKAQPPKGAPAAPAELPPPAPAAAPQPAPKLAQAASAGERGACPLRGRLGAAPCGCGGAACAAPASHAAPARADATVEELFPWLSMQEAKEQSHVEPAAPSAADAPHEDDDLCVICLDAPRDTPLAGCGAAHPAALCRGCAARVLADAAPACPLCRAPAAM